MMDRIAPEEGRRFYWKAEFEKRVDQLRTPRDWRGLHRICRQAVPHLPSRTSTTTPAVEIATAISGKRRERHWPPATASKRIIPQKRYDLIKASQVLLTACE